MSNKSKDKNPKKETKSEKVGSHGPACFNELKWSWNGTQHLAETSSGEVLTVNDLVERLSEDRLMDGWNVRLSANNAIETSTVESGFCRIWLDFLVERLTGTAYCVAWNEAKGLPEKEKHKLADAAFIAAIQKVKIV